MKKKYSIGLLISFFICSICAFDSFFDLKTYVEQYQEYPESNNIDWVFPDFRNYFKTMSQGIFSRWFEWFGIHTPSWSAKKFAQLIERVTIYRESKGLSGRFVQKIEPLEGEKFIVWGDLHGALHSFSRALHFLKNEGIIDAYFTISPGYTFVFNGNAIDRSAYSLETITILLTLMDRNPEQVVYVRGYHEDKQQWHDETFSDELQGKARHLSTERIPLNGLVTRFFSTLPVVFYITDRSGDTASSIYITGFLADQIGIHNEVNAFLASKMPERISIFKLNDVFEDKPYGVFNSKISAFIFAEDRFKSYRRTEGLVRLENEQKVAAWSIFSSPIKAHRVLYEFFHDAFAVISITESINSWTIQLYNRDVRDVLPFVPQESFLISSGVQKSEKQKIFTLFSQEKAFEDKINELEQEVEELEEKVEILEKKKKSVNDLVKIDTINTKQNKEEQAAVKDLSAFTFVTPLDFSKKEKNKGEQIKHGIQLWLAYETTLGTKIPNILFKDDVYNQESIKTIITDFISNNNSMLLCPVESFMIQSSAEFIKMKQMALLFPISGVSFLPDKNRSTIYFRPSYTKEAKVLVKHAVEALHAKKMVIFYQNDLFGKNALEGAVKIKQEKNISENSWLEIAYDANDVNFSDVAKNIKEFKPDTIFFFSSSRATKSLIRQIGIEFLAGKKLCGISNLTDFVFRQFTKEKGLSFILSSVVPDPETSELEIAQLFRKKTKEKNIPINTITFESFIATAILIDTCKKIKGIITREAMLHHMEQYTDYNLKGIVLRFIPETRSLSDKIWLITSF